MGCVLGMLATRYHIFGETLELAIKLEESSNRGTVLVDPVTRDRCGDRFNFQMLDKGFDWRDSEGNMSTLQPFKVVTHSNGRRSLAASRRKSTLTNDILLRRSSLFKARQRRVSDKVGDRDSDKLSIRCFIFLKMNNLIIAGTG